jgi:hypothetical protein
MAQYQNAGITTKDKKDVMISKIIASQKTPKTDRSNGRATEP